MTHGVVLAAVGLDLSARLVVRVLSDVVHSLEPHQELVDHFLILIILAAVTVDARPLSLRWAGTVVLLGSLWPTVWLQLIKIPEKGRLLKLVEFLQEHTAHVARELGARLGLMLARLHEVARVDELLVVDRGGVGVVLGLVHLEVVGTLLLVELAGHGVGLGRLDLFPHLVEIIEVLLLQVIVKKTRAFVLKRLRGQLLEFILNDFRYFQLKHAGEGLELGGQGLVNFGLERPLALGLVLAGARQGAARSLLRKPPAIPRSRRRTLRGLLLLGLSFIVLKSLQLLGEHVDLSHELDFVVSELNELVHHAVPLLLSLFPAFPGALPVFQLPIIEKKDEVLD